MRVRQPFVILFYGPRRRLIGCQRRKDFAALAGVKVQQGRKQEGPQYRGPSCLPRFIPEGQRPTAVLTGLGVTTSGSHVSRPVAANPWSIGRTGHISQNPAQITPIDRCDSGETATSISFADPRSSAHAKSPASTPMAQTTRPGAPPPAMSQIFSCASKTFFVIPASYIFKPETCLRHASSFYWQLKRTPYSGHASYMRVDRLGCPAGYSPRSNRATIPPRRLPGERICRGTLWREGPRCLTAMDIVK